jgi:hypothetical protein
MSSSTTPLTTQKYVTFYSTSELYYNTIILVLFIINTLLFVTQLFLNRNNPFRKIILLIHIISSFCAAFFIEVTIKAPYFTVNDSLYTKDIQTLTDNLKSINTSVLNQIQSNKEVIKSISDTYNSTYSNFNQYVVINKVLESITKNSKITNQLSKIDSIINQYITATYSINNPIPITNYSEYIEGKVPLSNYNLQQLLQLFELNTKTLNDQQGQLNGLLNLFKVVFPIQFANIPPYFFNEKVINQNKYYVQFPYSTVGSYFNLDNNLQILPLTNLGSQASLPIFISYDMNQSDFIAANNLTSINNEINGKFINELETKYITGTTLSYNFSTNTNTSTNIIYFNTLKIEDKHYLICFQSGSDNGPLFAILPSGHIIFFVTNTNNQDYNIKYNNTLKTYSNKNGTITQTTKPASTGYLPINLNSHNGNKVVLIIFDPYNNTYNLYAQKSASARSVSIGNTFTCSVAGPNIQDILEGYERTSIITPSDLKLYVNSLSVNKIINFNLNGKLSMSFLVNQDNITINYDGLNFSLNTPTKNITYSI